MGEEARDRIGEAMKQLYECPHLIVSLHKGRVVKIPAQKVELQARNGIKTTHEIVEDISEV